MYLTSDRTGSCSEYTAISDERVCSVVRKVFETLPDAGETHITGACRQRNIFVQRHCFRNAINTVHPVS